MMRPSTSLRVRLTLWYTSVLAVIILVLGTALYLILSRALYRDVDAALHSVAEAVASSNARWPGGPPFFEVEDILRNFLGPSLTDKFFQMFEPGERAPSPPISPRGFRLRVSPEALANARLGRATFETLTGSAPAPIRVLTYPIMAGDSPVRIIQVGLSLTGVRTALRHYLVILLTVAPFALGFAAAGGWVLARRALRPVDEIARTARRISAENLSERLPPPGQADELGRLVATINDMLDRLDAAFRQIRQFSADASHELRTPLTILKGEVELALRAPREADEYRRVLGSALEEVDRMTRVVEDLLLLAKADAGAVPLSVTEVPLREVVDRVAAKVRPLAERNGVALVAEADEVQIQGDALRLEQLVVNLVDNAIKYTPSGGRVRILARARPAPAPGAGSSEPGPSASAEAAEIIVRDTGIGIAPAHQARVFDRFFRVDKARSREEGGSGLGLSIARWIAESHGGTIRLESAPGHGCTFTVVLPLQPPGR